MAENDAETPGDGPRDRIRIQGNSGCQVRLIRRKGRVFVEKSSSGERYNARLGLQFRKQAEVRGLNRLPFVRVPEILETGERDGLAFARMEYVYFLDSVDYFASASIDDIDGIARMITAFIDEEINDSPLVEVPAGRMIGKLEEIEAALGRGGELGRYRGAIDALKGLYLEPIRLPVGRCHGDLTFSNIMIAGDSRAIALIDFLDSFLESPIIDIAKVRQDSRFCWSLLMSTGEHDPVRFRLVMKYLDARICEHYSGAAWFSRNIDPILALNMLRIAPYAKHPGVHRFILDAIDSLELRR